MDKQGFGLQITQQEFTMLKKRKHSGFNAAYRLYADYVYSLSLHLVCDQQQATDILEQVFDMLIQHSSSVTQKELLGPWLKQCTIDVCTEYFRQVQQEQHTQALLASKNSDQLPIKEQVVPNNNDNLQQMNDLPLAQRSIVYLHTVQNLKHREIIPEDVGSSSALVQAFSGLIERFKRGGS